MNDPATLKDIVTENLKTFPLSGKYLAKSIRNLLQTSNWLENRLCRYLLEPKKFAPFEERLNEVTSFMKHVERPMARLQTNPIEYQAVMNELFAAIELRRRGYFESAEFTPREAATDIQFGGNHVEVKRLEAVDIFFDKIRDLLETEFAIDPTFKPHCQISWTYNGSWKIPDVKAAVEKVARQLLEKLRSTKDAEIRIVNDSLTVKCKRPYVTLMVGFGEPVLVDVSQATKDVKEIIWPRLKENYENSLAKFRKLYGEASLNNNIVFITIPKTNAMMVFEDESKNAIEDELRTILSASSPKIELAYN